MYLVIEGVTNITLVHMKGIIRFAIIKLLINTFEALKLGTILLSTISLIIGRGQTTQPTHKLSSMKSFN